MDFHLFSCCSQDPPHSAIPLPVPRSWGTSSSATCRATRGACTHLCAHVCTDTRALAHAHQQQELLGFTAGFGHGEDAAVGGRVGAQKPDPGGVPVLVSLQRVLQGCGESRVPWHCTHACLQRNLLCAHVSPAHPRVCMPTRVHLPLNVCSHTRVPVDARTLAQVLVNIPLPPQCIPTPAPPGTH